MQRLLGSSTWWLIAIAVAGIVLAATCRPVRELTSTANPLSQEINLVYLSGLLPDDVVEEFQSEFGIRVNRTRVHSNDALLRAVGRKEGKPFDLAMPTSFMANRLIEQKMLRRFTPDRLTNLPPAESNPHVYAFDKEARFTVPYLRGATGIAYDRDGIDGLPKSWSRLFEPDVQHPLKIALMDDLRYTLGSALIYLGHSPNSRNKAEIVAAGELLKRLAGREVYFESEHVAAMLADRTVDLALTRSADATKAMQQSVLYWREHGRRTMKERAKVLMALPEEGSITFRAGFVLLESTQNQSGAENFVNFMLRPRIAGRVSNQTFCATAVEYATPYVSRFIINSASYFFHPAGKDFRIDFVTAEVEEIYREVWEDVKRTLGARKYTPPARK